MMFYDCLLFDIECGEKVQCVEDWVEVNMQFQYVQVIILEFFLFFMDDWNGSVGLCLLYVFLFQMFIGVNIGCDLECICVCYEIIVFLWDVWYEVV